MRTDFIVHAAAPVTGKQLGRNHHIIPHAAQRLSDDALVVTDAGQSGAVNLRRVEQGAAVALGVADGLDTVFLGGDLSVAVGERHAAHADLGDFDLTQEPCLHCFLSSVQFISAGPNCGDHAAVN